MSGFGLVKTNIYNRLNMAIVFSLLLGMNLPPLMYFFTKGDVAMIVLCAGTMLGALLVILGQVGGVQNTLDAIDEEIQKIGNEG